MPHRAEGPAVSLGAEPPRPHNKQHGSGGGAGKYSHKASNETDAAGCEAARAISESNPGETTEERSNSNPGDTIEYRVRQS